MVSYWCADDKQILEPDELDDHDGHTVWRRVNTREEFRCAKPGCQWPGGSAKKHFDETGHDEYTKIVRLIDADNDPARPETHKNHPNAKYTGPPNPHLPPGRQNA